LYYGLGIELGPKQLAEALRMAGAEHAAELDINYAWTRFLIAGRLRDGAGNVRPRITSTLVEGMMYGKTEYIERPSTRDFFYVVRRRRRFTGQPGPPRRGRVRRTIGVCGVNATARSISKRTTPLNADGRATPPPCRGAGPGSTALSMTSRSGAVVTRIGREILPRSSRTREASGSTCTAKPRQSSYRARAPPSNRRSTQALAE
jgi:hypothetical protein